MSTPKLDSFTQAYVVCALWTGVEPPADHELSGIDNLYDFDISDIDAESLARMVADCARFQKEQAELLASLPSECEQDGHDFWLTRNGHGAGFWDRGYGDAGKKISDAAKGYGEVHLYVGDDERVHCA